ncbi:MAG: type II toxin-antitoxin system VapC family toxin [Gammaproteobacteria bacterium]|nr:type II toxin-antitoxin system VapC family toxin [Gammaproteobacteria bacterium]
MRPLVIDASVWVSAADATDALSEVSRTFLAGVVARELPVSLPEIARVEIACALARRLRDAEQGRSLAERMLGSPLVRTYSLNRARLREAVRLGTGRYLRSGDALYAALAEGLEGEVVTWDRELVERAGALTPRDWIDARSRGTSPAGPAGSP